jgi:hypothetical protein
MQHVFAIPGGLRLSEELTVRFRIVQGYYQDGLGA